MQASMKPSAPMLAPKQRPLKPPSPLRPRMQANVKPPAPLLAPKQRPLKPATPLQPKNAQKTASFRPQRRCRFQLGLGLREQRRCRFQPHAQTSEQRRQGFHARDFQCPRAIAGPGRASRRKAEAHIRDPAPLVWRAPEGPEGTGGLRGAAPNEVRPPSLAGGRALRRPEHQRSHKQQHATRTARGRAAAHGRTKQPGPTSQARRRPEHHRCRKHRRRSGEAASTAGNQNSS